MKIPFRSVFGAVTILLAVSGCAFSAGRADPEQPGDLRYVIVDGERVPTAGEESLLELLRRKLTARQLGENAARPQDEPAVFLDGVLLNGIYRLAEIPAFHAQCVQRLRGPQAVPHYGPRARSGAIVISTR
jgi:hypothetical protein